MKLPLLSTIFFAALAAATPAGVAHDGEALERGLAAVQTRNISADIFFIASDEMAGRDTPSSGLKMTARYIRARLQRLGFTPCGEEGGFFDYYQLSRSGLNKEETAAWIGFEDGEKKELAFGEDYYFWPGGNNDSDVQGEVVFIGDGSAEALAQAEGLEGRWAFALGAGTNSRAGIPGVQEAGAKGLILGNGQNREFARRIGQFAARSSLKVVTEKKAGKSGFPTVFFTNETTADLLAAGAPIVGESLGFEFRELRTSSGDETHTLENVAGLWPGSDPELKHEVIIISAHYDHVGTDGVLIFNGADDNGSGTSGMLALAEALNAYGPMRRSVLLLWVSGEEKGLLGSYAWTTDPTLPEGYEAVCALNIDMIGRNAADYLLITPTREHPAYNGLTRLAEEMAPSEGFPELGSCDEYWRRSDHMNFNDQLGIPVAFLFSDVHADYHQPTDTPDKIDCDKIRRVTRTVFKMIDALQTDTLSLERQ